MPSKMTRDQREEDVNEFYERLKDVAENYASDIAKERGITFDAAMKISMAGLRRLAREGVEMPDGKRF